MNLIALIILTATLVGLAASQSLVLVGGGLTDGNAEVWNKVVSLAVRKISNRICMCMFFFYTISNFHLREEKV
jgi:hypothetical protein